MKLSKIFRWIATRAEIFTIFFSLLFSFLVRISAFFPSFYKTGTLYSDDAIYMDMARSIYFGNFLRAIHPFWAPFYPFVSSIFFNLLKDWRLSGIFVSLISGTILIIPIYKILKFLNIKRSYFVGLVLLSTLNVLILASLRPLSESLFVLLIWTVVALYLSAVRKNKINYFFLTGVFTGICALTRSEGVYVFLSIVFIEFVFVSRSILLRNHKALRRYIKVITIFIVGFFITYYPYQAILQAKYKTNLSLSKVIAIFKLSSPFNLDSTGTTTWAQDVDSLDTFNPKSEFFQNGKEFVMSHWATILSDWKIRTAISIKMILHEFAAAGIVLFIIGTVVAFRKKDFGGLAVFVVVAFGLLFTMFFAGQAEIRYLIGIIPGIIILINYGFEFIVGYVDKRSFILGNILISFALFVLLFVNNNYQVFLNIFNTGLGSDNVKSNITDGCAGVMDHKKVMLRHEGYVFDDQSFIIYTPNTPSIDGIIKYAKLKNADYLIAAPGEIIENYNYLFLKPKNYSGLNLICSSTPKGFYVYKIVR